MAKKRMRVRMKKKRKKRERMWKRQRKHEILQKSQTLEKKMCVVYPSMSAENEDQSEEDLMKMNSLNLKHAKCEKMRGEGKE